MNHAKLLEMQKQLDDATNANDVLNGLDALVKSTQKEQHEMTNETYNGYESYDHWNTALWINNDQRFYNLLKNKVELVVYMHMTKTQAVYEMLRELPEQTPDGATWEADTILDLIDEHYEEQLQYS